jgi:uncharacterized SAM-binding protein YcdF (DUF218 family)
LLIGVGAAGFLAVGLIVSSAGLGGRSLAERTATDLVMPVGLLWLLLLAAAATSWVRRQTPMAAFFLLLWLTVAIVFNGRVAQAFAGTIEYAAESDPATSLSSKLKAVILLGGFASNNRFEVPELGFDGQRFLLAAQLWHAGKTETLICTGTGIAGRADPSLLGRRLLRSIGVPDQVIFEVPGVNTASEMAHLKDFFDHPPASWTERCEAAARSTGPGMQFDSPARIGLVTSALHLPRAIRLAEQHDLDVVPLPCLFRSGANDRLTPRQLIPSAGSGVRFAGSLKEWLAGWIRR